MKSNFQYDSTGFRKTTISLSFIDFPRFSKIYHLAKMDIFMSVYIAVALLVIIVYIWSKWNYSYWKRRGLEYLEPEFYGNIKGICQRKVANVHQVVKIYKSFKSRGLKCGGMYTFFKPIFIPVDLDLVKTIMQKNFDHFRNHGLYFNKNEPLSGHLFNLENDQWRRIRTKLTPAFTSGKMKMMFPAMVAYTDGLETVLQDLSKFPYPIDIKDVVSRFTTDVIGSVVFGIHSNSLENPNSEFREVGREILRMSFVKMLKNFLELLFPRKFYVSLGIQKISSEVKEFFMKVVRDTIHYRESNNIYRKDFLQLMLQLRNSGEVGEKEATLPVKRTDEKFLTLNEVAAQCYIFFLAGFEMSATTMTFAILELALNQDIQEKLREEIQKVLEEHNEEITYDAIMSMSYLDKVISETLRKHSPAPAVPRVCNKAFKIPGREVTIEKGIRLWIPIHAIHMDPEHYPDPEVFDPERFNEENKARRHPLAFLPFGEGPRICIGARFAFLQMKVGLTAILKKFRITLDEKTKVPVKYSDRMFITSVDGGVWIRVSPL